MADDSHSTDLAEKGLSTRPQLDPNLWLYNSCPFEKQLLLNWINPLSVFINAEDIILVTAS